jgi:hypothetical protein
MNTQRLSTLYDQITVWERIPLLLAAQARKDDDEHDRLFTSSPLRTWRFSEHLLAEQALHVLALTYINEQLDAAASCFFALFQLLASKEHPEQNLELLADSSAYLFTIRAEAWKQFCSFIPVPSEQLTSSNYDGWLLRYFEEHLPPIAPNADELRASHKELNRQTLVTPETLSKHWYDLLQEMTRSSPHRATL